MSKEKIRLVREGMGFCVKLQCRVCNEFLKPDEGSDTFICGCKEEYTSVEIEDMISRGNKND